MKESSIQVVTPPRNLTAIHEAGHAVIAAYLRDSFTRVTIFKSRPHVRMEPYRGTGRSILNTVLVAKHYRFISRRGIVAVGARAAVEYYKHILTRNQRHWLFLEMSYEVDEKRLKFLSDSYFDDIKIGEASFKEWREHLLVEARNIVAIPFVARAIAVVALELQNDFLFNKKGMPSKRVRQLLQQSQILLPNVGLPK
jgi:hypothetical protein